MAAGNKQIITFISRSAPYNSDAAFACLDMVLAFAVFDQNVNYLFRDDGVYQLLADQQGEAVQQKTLGAALEALDLYGVKNVWVDGQSLKARGLAEKDLCLPVQLIDAAATERLLSDSRQVFVL